MECWDLSPSASSFLFPIQHEVNRSLPHAPTMTYCHEMLKATGVSSHELKPLIPWNKIFPLLSWLVCISAPSSTPRIPFLFFFIYATGVGMQGFMLSRQVLYYLSHSTSLLQRFYSWYLYHSLEFLLLRLFVFSLLLSKWLTPKTFLQSLILFLLLYLVYWWCFLLNFHF
jgi:hypothetical protein